MKDKKYQISYTLKKPNSNVSGRELFKTKAKAKEWLKKNKKNIYWFQLTEINAKSIHPKPMIQFDPPTNKYTKKVGTLQTHFETGMECLGLIFYEDGIYNGPNPSFDPSKPEGGSNFKYYASWDAITFIEKGQIIEFPDGKKIGMIKDHDFGARDGHRLSFYPAGFSRKELIELFSSETVKVTIWIPIDKHSEEIKKFIRGPF